VPLSQLSEAVEVSHRALATIIRGDVEPFLALYSDAVHRHADPINAVRPAESVATS
jgi:hypothetical protein